MGSHFVSLSTCQVVKSNDERRRQEIAQQAHLARDVANTTVGLMEWKSETPPPH
jgi:hypothetical protein